MRLIIIIIIIIIIGKSLHFYAIFFNLSILKLVSYNCLPLSLNILFLILLSEIILQSLFTVNIGNDL